MPSALFFHWHQICNSKFCIFSKRYSIAISYYIKYNFFSYGCIASYHLTTFHGSNNSVKVEFTGDLEYFYPGFLKIISVDISSLLGLPNSLTYCLSVHLHFRSHIQIYYPYIQEVSLSAFLFIQHTRLGPQMHGFDFVMLILKYIQSLDNASQFPAS